MDETMDSMITDNLSTHDFSDNSSIYDYSEPSTYYNTEHPGPGISLDLPPSSGVSSGVSSGITSDSDLPPPPSKPSKPVHQTGLLNFFSAIPADKAHATWSEKKRKNRDRDEEVAADTKCREKKQKEHKLQVSREKNRLSQQKHRMRIQDEEINAGIRDEDGKKIQVRWNLYVKAS